MFAKKVFTAALAAMLADPAAADEPNHDKHEHSGKFHFALIGDLPYAEDGKFENLMAEINDDRKVKWVLHAGDIKNGSSLCSDEHYQRLFDTFQQFDRPFILTPGDNEWTDCHRPAAGGYMPLERLAKLREMFYPSPGLTLGGKAMKVDTQAADPGYAEFPENVRWTKGNVVFAAMHIVGSRNALAKFPGRSTVDDEEVARRTDAAIAWMKEAFELAEKRNSPGVFLMIHANPRMEEPANSDGRRGFNEFLNALEEEVIEFGKPVVLAHGDTHYFRYDKPLKNAVTNERIENFTRLETFGSGDVHWVRVLVDPASPQVFHIRQEIVDANR